MQLRISDPLPIDTPVPPPPNGADGLIYLAMCLASITPNTASTERVFSQFKILHSPRRNRLSHNLVRKMTMVKYAINQEHAAASHPKRKHGKDVMAPPESTPLFIETKDHHENALDMEPSNGFRSTILDLIDDSNENPGISNEELNEIDRAQPDPDITGRPSGIHSSESQIVLHIPLDSAVRTKQSKMLRYLFPRLESASVYTTSAQILDEFWSSAEADLSWEQTLHDNFTTTISNSLGTVSLGP
jgi:hypothetical protein